MPDRKDLPPDVFTGSRVRTPRREEALPTSRATQPQQRARASVEKTGTQAITTGAGFTVVTFSVTLFDNIGLYTANKFTIPTLGKVTAAWRLNGQVTWAGDAAGTRRQLRLRKNGTTTLRTVDMSPVANAQSELIDYMVNDPNTGDFYELLVSHDAGHDVNVTVDAQFAIIHLW